MFYLLTLEEAQAIGKFEYEPDKFFDPLSTELESGEYAVSFEIYELLKDDDRMKKINWTKTTDKLNHKYIDVKL